jgi:NAD-dependent SIR2 family protein deacetylase
MYRGTAPHEGFNKMLKIAVIKKYFVYTSNVDGHFLKAGFDEQKIVECHGSLMHFQCS